jgi:hypothetical protein
MIKPETDKYAFYVYPIEYGILNAKGIGCKSVQDLKDVLTNFNYDADDVILNTFYIYSTQQHETIFEYSWYVSYTETNGDTYEEHINHLKEKITQFINQL